MRQRAALAVALLDDDSPRVLAEVRAELERLGAAGRPALRRAAKNGSPRARSRARQLLLEGERRRAVRRLVRYAARAEHDLETALCLLDAHGSPGADLRGTRRVLDALGEGLRARLGSEPPGPRRVEALVRHLAVEVGFAGAAADFHHPDNIYLRRALERRQGMPLTLCAIYAFVARRAGLRAGLLPFPGHVLLAVDEGDQRTILDAFGGGASLSLEECLRYLARHGLPQDPAFLEPAPDTTFFLRHVTNLIHSCRRRGRRAEAGDLERVRTVLERRGGAGRV